MFRVLDVARMLSVSPDWLKKLERTGKLPPAARDVNGHRRYTSADVDHIRALLLPAHSE